VNVWDFCKITSVFAVSPRVAREISAAGIRLAEEEGLTGHARAMRARLEEGEEAR